MFTLDQINVIHDIIGKQSTLADYLFVLNKIGVEKYDSFILDGHSEYYGKDNYKVISAAEHKNFPIASTCNQQEFLKQLSLHEQGETDYIEMSKGLAASGVEKWTFDTNKMTITYSGVDGSEMLVEKIE